MSVRNCRPLWLVVLGTVAMVAGSLWLLCPLLWPRTAISEANAARIQPGMELEEVEAILGGPSRDASTGMLLKTGRTAFYVDFPGFRQHQAWITDWLVVEVTFDDDMRVVNVERIAVEPRGEPLFERLRRNIGL